jgi:A/G-specific adenine glycosylase
MDLSTQQKTVFLETLWEFYAGHGRHDLPWRVTGVGGSLEAYNIMVSELMLQQTQVSRVIPKYHAFLGQFPTVQVLASAELGEVLRSWQGLGYNRRAKFLWQAAKMVDNLKHFPDTSVELVRLPGVGVNTAGAILAYAYNFPALFVETNVRTVYIYHFLQGRDDVHDSEITSLLAQTLDREQPREFYWALMDYGSYLKTVHGNPNRASKHYVKQSKFHGSRRQLRGQVIRLLGATRMSSAELQAVIPDERLTGVLEELLAEGLIGLKAGIYTL